MARAFRADAPLWAVPKAYRGPQGRTALQHAAAAGDVERARFLLERGAVIEGSDNGGTTALMWACMKGRLEVGRFLVEQGGANVNAAQADGGYTALMWACEEGHLETVRYLVERGGAAVNAAATNELMAWFL